MQNVFNQKFYFTIEVKIEIFKNVYVYLYEINLKRGTEGAEFHIIKKKNL